MDEIRIVLVEDDVPTCKRFWEDADKRDDIVIVATTGEAATAISQIHYYLPDVVILDLELNAGSGSGLEVLAGIKDLKKQPYIIVTTNNSSQMTYEYARGLGADYIMYKHQQGYSEKSVMDMLSIIAGFIKKNNVHKELEEIETPEYISKRTMNYIHEELNLIGINPKVVGYEYLADAIMILISDTDVNVCSMIAKNVKKTEKCVRTAMQRAIERAWNVGDEDTLIKNYTARITSDNGCPTLMEFLYYYVGKVKIRMK